MRFNIRIVVQVYLWSWSFVHVSISCENINREQIPFMEVLLLEFSIDMDISSLAQRIWERCDAKRRGLQRSAARSRSPRAPSAPSNRFACSCETVYSQAGVTPTLKNDSAVVKLIDVVTDRNYSVVKVLSIVVADTRLNCFVSTNIIVDI